MASTRTPSKRTGTAGYERNAYVAGTAARPVSYTHLDVYKRQTVNLHGMADPAGLITYEYTVEGEATTTTDENGNVVNTPGTKTRKTSQRTVMFTAEG